MVTKCMQSMSMSVGSTRAIHRSRGLIVLVQVACLYCGIVVIALLSSDDQGCTTVHREFFHAHAAAQLQEWGLAPIIPTRN